MLIGLRETLLYTAYKKGAAVASAGRLQRFFSSPEIKPYVQELSQSDQAVCFRGANIKWSAASDRVVLKQVNLIIPQRRLTVIHGRVGAGKTLLVSAIIGDVTLKSGEVLVARTKPSEDKCAEETGGIAYCAQRPFILNATVRSNILFGAHMVKERYDIVVWASCLGPDLEQLPRGDLTQIGERGVNLSGGQKARISLARALYRKSPSMYVFDDVLSALDVNVTQNIIERCFRGILRGRTCILTTNSEALDATADLKVVVEDGTVNVEIGEKEEGKKWEEQPEDEEGMEEKVKAFVRSERVLKLDREQDISLRMSPLQATNAEEDDSGNAVEFREVGTVRR